jgi:hypothetical protein
MGHALVDEGSCAQLSRCLLRPASVQDPGVRFQDAAGRPFVGARHSSSCGLHDAALASARMQSSGLEAAGWLVPSCDR